MIFRRNMEKLPYFILCDENKPYIAQDSQLTCVHVWDPKHFHHILSHSTTRFAVIPFGRKPNQQKYLPGHVNKTRLRIHFLYVLLINFRKRCASTCLYDGYEYTCATQYLGDELEALTKMTALLRLRSQYLTPCILSL